jgi:DNA polymerase III epsilon subunit-like protein
MWRWWDGRAWTAHTAPVSPPVASPQLRDRDPVPHIPTARLTRKKTPFPVGSATYTAVDVETTGLDPALGRILEIGLVKFTADGTVLGEFATLVASPFINKDAAAINHITESDLRGAPPIEDVLVDAFAFISGTVVVCHNLEFEEGFLSEAAARAGIGLPDVIGVCTLDACRRLLDGRSFSLIAMHKTATGEFHDKHKALADARAVKDVFQWLVRTAPTPLHLSERPRGAPSPVLNFCQTKCRPIAPIRAAKAELRAYSAPGAQYLRGLRIAIIGGDALTIALRDQAQEYGAQLAVKITKTVQWLATSTPDARDSRHDAARRLGIPIIDPDDASVRLNKSIHAAELTASQRQRELEEYEAARRRRKAEDDAYWRPVWRKSELDKPQFARGFEG